MSAPAISVLMPVHNAARYVDAAMRSILAQTFDDFELLVLDDGSTDDSAARVERCAADDGRVKLLRRPNRGLVPALNELVGLARGELVARMDGDDIARPQRFARQVDHLRAHPSCVAVGTRALFVDPDGAPIFDYVDHFDHAQIEAALLRPMIGILHPTVMMRRAAVIAAGGYANDYPHVEDLDLFLRLAEIGELANLPEVLLSYRVHAKSVSHAHTAQQHKAGLRAVKAACARRGIPFRRESELNGRGKRGETEGELHLKWAWWALGGGHPRTARKHALCAVLSAPTNTLTWRALACAIRGR